MLKTLLPARQGCIFMYLIAGFSLLRMSGVLILDPTGQFFKLTMGKLYFGDLLKTLKVIIRYSKTTVVRQLRTFVGV